MNNLQIKNIIINLNLLFMKKIYELTNFSS